MVAPSRPGIKSGRVATFSPDGRGRSAVPGPPTGIDGARIEPPPEFIRASDGQSDGRPQPLELGDGAVPGQRRQGARGREADPVPAPSIARGGVGGRPEQRLRPVVRSGQWRKGAADDPAGAGCGPDQPPVLRPGDEVHGQAGVWRGDDGRDPGWIHAPADDGQGQVRPRHAVGEDGVGVREPFPGLGIVPSVGSAGSWTSISGQPAPASSQHDPLSAPRAARSASASPRSTADRGRPA